MIFEEEPLVLTEEVIEEETLKTNNRKIRTQN